MISSFYTRHSMMAIKALDGRIIEVNSSWLNNIGYSKEEVIGKTEEELDIWGTPETRDTIIGLLINNGNVYDLEIKFKTKEGQPCIGLLNIEQLEIDSKKYYLESLTDYTKQKELEKEIVKLDRLKMIGQLAAGVSHEFRNPITTVRGFIQMLSVREELNNIKEYFDIMIEEIDRANAIVTEFLSLTKNKSLELRKNNINGIINKIFPMIQANAYIDNKEVYLDLADVPDINMDESEIRQLILNVTRNAIEASPVNSIVTIRTYCEGEEVVLSVQDQGNGIAQEILSKIGTPFFTTKIDGTGIGLVICFRIAERHNAKIVIDSGAEGTLFLVKFKALFES